MIGPMLVTDLYQIFGTYALFGDVAATLVSATLLKQELSKKTIWQTSQCGCCRAPACCWCCSPGGVWCLSSVREEHSLARRVRTQPTNDLRTCRVANVIMLMKCEDRMFVKQLFEKRIFAVDYFLLFPFICLRSRPVCRF